MVGRTGLAGAVDSSGRRDVRGGHVQRSRPSAAGCVPVRSIVYPHHEPAAVGDKRCLWATVQRGHHPVVPGPGRLCSLGQPDGDQHRSRMTFRKGQVVGDRRQPDVGWDRGRRYGALTSSPCRLTGVGQLGCPRWMVCFERFGKPSAACVSAGRALLLVPSPLLSVGDGRSGAGGGACWPAVMQPMPFRRRTSGGPAVVGGCQSRQPRVQPSGSHSWPAAIRVSACRCSRSPTASSNGHPSPSANALTLGAPYIG